MPQYRFGEIVEVSEVYDPTGRNPKPRPVLIISHTADISAGEEILGVAISTKGIPPRPAKLPEDLVELPHSDSGTCRTGLTERSVAKCRWLVRFSQERVLYKRGEAPGQRIEEVMRFLVPHKT